MKLMSENSNDKLYSMLKEKFNDEELRLIITIYNHDNLTSYNMGYKEGWNDCHIKGLFD